MVDEAVFTDLGSLALFVDPHRFHLIVAKVGIFARTSTAATIGAGHATEPKAIVAIARVDPVEGHELEIVLMCADRQMRATRIRPQVLLPRQE